MLMKTRVDASGRVVIPVEIRRRLGLFEGGGEVDLVDTPDGVVIRSSTAPVPLRDARGLLVVELGRQVTTAEVLAAVTEDRERVRE